MLPVRVACVWWGGVCGVVVSEGGRGGRRVEEGRRVILPPRPIQAAASTPSFFP